MRQLLPGIASDQPTLFVDPAFTRWDEDLLTALGGRVVSDVAHAVSGASDISPGDAQRSGGGALLYMPCCPRSLYADVVMHAAAAGMLQHTAILGNSFRCLVDSDVLLRAFSNSAGSKLVDEDQDDAHSVTPPLIQHLVRSRLCVEVPAPDCLAHGVAVGLHAFPLPAAAEAAAAIVAADIPDVSLPRFSFMCQAATAYYWNDMSRLHS
jgi:hypothetical protein